MVELTERQTDVLRAIFKYTQANGYAPSMRDLGAALGINSTNGVRDHLRTLERKGMLVLGPRGTCRATRLTARGQTLVAQ